MRSFSEYLATKTPEMIRALTDDTYKNVWQRKTRSAKTLPDCKVNSELATFGDAVLKFLLAEMLFDKVENITEEKKHYESDRVLVSVIGRHYDLLRYLRYDKTNEKIPQNYNYGDDRHKYIATALEAALGAIYLTEGIDACRAVVCEWYDIITEANKRKRK